MKTDEPGASRNTLHAIRGRCQLRRLWSEYGNDALEVVWHTHAIHANAPKDNKVSVDSPYILGWRDSSITGQFLIQLASIAGPGAISINTATNSGLMKALGVKYTIERDRKGTEQIVAEIKAIGGDQIAMGVDLVDPFTVAALRYNAFPPPSPPDLRLATPVIASSSLDSIELLNV